MSENSNDSPPPSSQIILYQTEDGRSRIEVRLENETVWLTQQLMAELFQTTQQNISLHIQNIYAEGELRPEATHKDFLSVRREGNRDVQRRLEFYNLDMIISVGYRVKSAVATRFRQWATWTGGRVLKRDVPTAKNYLDGGEIDTLNRIVVMFLDQAEFRAQRRQDIKMRDWTLFLDKFLRDTELPVLDGSGTVSQEDARSWAESQYDAFAERRRLEAEEAAEKQYVQDLKNAAKTLEAAKKKPSAKRKGRKS